MLFRFFTLGSLVFFSCMGRAFSWVDSIFRKSEGILSLEVCSIFKVGLEVLDVISLEVF